MTKCCLVKDLLPLYADDLVCDESKVEIQDHINGCASCQSYYEGMLDEPKVLVPLSEEVLEDKGRVIVGQIKKNQNRIKYTVIIFSMIVAICTTYLASGFISSIPLIMIVPFVLNLLFKEGKVTLITAVLAHVVVTFSMGQGIAFTIVAFPLTLLCVSAGLFLGSCVKDLFERGNK
ncbi:MAG TPA: hypothetical protein DCY20_05960 [Firmicutes bacterium]|nr:hypothetical protein [Bacillota bacterium]